MIRELWGWIDIRDGKRVSITSCYSKEQAERILESWQARDRRGGRPDLHELIPYIKAVKLTWSEDGTRLLYTP